MTVARVVGAISGFTLLEQYVPLLFSSPRNWGWSAWFS